MHSVEQHGNEVHISIVTITCEMCKGEPKSFLHEADYQAHIRLAHGDEEKHPLGRLRKEDEEEEKKTCHQHKKRPKRQQKPHICERCSTVYSNKANYKRHKANAQCGKCDLCGKGFLSSNALRKHKNEHALQSSALVVAKFLPTAACQLEDSSRTGDVAVECLAAGNKLYTMNFTSVEVSATNIRHLAETAGHVEIIKPKHEDTHSSETTHAPMYKCQYCQFVYSSKEFLTTHTLSSHVCKVCMRSFKLPRDLHAHISADHQRSICAVCKKELSSQSNLRAHMKRMHRLKVPPQMTLLDCRPTTGEPASVVIKSEVVENEPDEETTETPLDVPAVEVAVQLDADELIVLKQEPVDEAISLEEFLLV